jgi:CRISPR/Cas system CSM-associated protein Csm2 small subunit
MIQVMEAWIVADPDAVEAHYGQHFLKNALPRAENLESIEKQRIYDAMKHATAKTQKGEYHKIGHAAALLEMIDPAKVRRRCPSCNRLFATLTERIDRA